MLIRPETPSDYAAIAEVNVLAFENRAAEAAIVALLRQHATFDPELSLVAEVGGRIVGHVLFTPYTIRLMEQDVRAVNLAPLAVLPAHQGRGIGGKLIEEGHTVARAKGYQLSFLLGHAGYYPRFGYQTRAYGASSLSISTADLPDLEMETRSPTPDDVEALRSLWRSNEQPVDFAIEPGAALLDWLSPNPNVPATVYLRHDEIAGYTRINANDRDKPLLFLAQDASAALGMVKIIARDEQADKTLPELVLPLHPLSPLGNALGEPGSVAWEVGMAFSLADSPFEEYYAGVRRGERPPGRVIWPPAFDIA